ncbi:MAG TPA: CBS domain-containing protein [Rhodothermales bacterium]|nr:CBS domain-containing protein [Rhodothermales bacterium]
MRIADILQDKGSKIITVQAKAPLDEAIAMLDRERIGAVPVVNEKQQVVGVLSERDLVSVLAEYRDRALHANVGALMSRRVYVCTLDDEVEEALAWMVAYRVRHLPVVEGDRLCGLVSIGDLVKHMVGKATSQPGVLQESVAAS